MIEIFGDDIKKEDVKGIKEHVGARAIVKKGDKYLLVHLKKLNLYTLPGGGALEGEGLQDAAMREVQEETGYLTSFLRNGVTIKEYFIDSVWVNHYFVLQAIGQGTIRPTSEEKAMGLAPVWMTLEEALYALSEDQSSHEHGEAILNREFIGFTQSL